MVFMSNNHAPNPALRCASKATAKAYATAPCKPDLSYTPRDGATADLGITIDSWPSLSITFGTIPSARSISGSELNRPNEKRRLPRARSSFKYIARSTCEASAEPVRQAEPAEQQTPCRSNSSSAAFESIPPKEKLEVFGSRAMRSPLIDAPLTASRIPFSKRSRMARTRFSSSVDRFCGALRSFSQSDDRSDIFCSGTSPVLLTTTDDRRLKTRIPLNIECADAFRSMKFVRGEREKIDRGLAEPDRNFSGRLHRIGVEEYPFLATNFRDFLDRKQNPGLIIGPHHRDDCRVLAGLLARARQRSTCAHLDRRQEMSLRIRVWRALGNAAGRRCALPQS